MKELFRNRRLFATWALIGLFLVPACGKSAKKKGDGDTGTENGGILLFDDRNQANADLQKVLANICQASALSRYRPSAPPTTHSDSLKLSGRPAITCKISMPQFRSA